MNEVTKLSFSFKKEVMSNQFHSALPLPATPGNPELQPEAPQDRPKDWKSELLTSMTQVSELVRLNLVSADEAKQLSEMTEDFKLRITPYYANLITNSPDCPIRKQAIPHLNEKDPSLPPWASQWSQKIYGRPEPWHFDPIGDVKLQAAPRLTHRYSGRALLHLSSMCAVYCRFCFRKSLLNDDSRTLYEGALDPAFQYLAKTPDVTELILTGGDPLSLADPMLERVFQRVATVSSIRTLRIHSRMAVTLPHRFTPTLLELLQREWPFQICLVSHFNHPKELTPLACDALKKLRRAGVTLLNQSVLMNGVNHSASTLGSLFQNLYENGAIPYYLHHPDWTPGTFHFRTTIEEGKKLMEELRGRISGPALPDYILDVPQGMGKISLMADTLERIDHYDSEEMTGTVYQVKTPNTRRGSKAEELYLDLAPRFS